MRGPHSPPDCIYLLFDTSVIFAAHCFCREDPDETESSTESDGDDSDDELEAPASVEITSGSGSKKKTVTALPVWTFGNTSARVAHDSSYLQIRLFQKYLQSAQRFPVPM